MRHPQLAAFSAIAIMLAGTACGSSSTQVTSTTYIATMNGANERPSANTSTATGTGTYVLSGNTLTYTLTATGLSAPASGSHLHIGSSAVAGAVLVPYTTAAVTSGQVTTGSIDLSQPITNGSVTISGDSLRVLLNNGNAYSNVHNSVYPGGEIRGQLIRQN